MSAGQIHAPPNDAEYEQIVADREAGRTIANTDKRLWVEPNGWCSACYMRPVRVVHYGVEERNFALCWACVEKMSDAFAPSPCASGAEEPKR